MATAQRLAKVQSRRGLIDTLFQNVTVINLAYIPDYEELWEEHVIDIS